MAIDFSQVKKITIPEGSVKKITDSNGAVLWKEQSAEWHTTYDNSSGMILFKLDNPYSSWNGSSSVPCDINDKTTKLRITYRQDYTLARGGVKTVWNNNGSPAITDTSIRRQNYTRTFDYTQGKDIVFFTITDRNNKKASCSWYKNGIWRGGIPNDFGMGGYLKIYKVEQYY